MTFQQLRSAALAEIRKQISNGYFTERGLARLARVSQPQVHNVLKGARLPSTATLDRLCRAAAIDIGELASSDQSSEPQEAWWKIAA